MTRAGNGFKGTMHSEWISEADVQPFSTNGSPQGVEMGVQSSANTRFFLFSGDAMIY